MNNDQTAIILTKPHLRLAAAREAAGYRTAKEFADKHDLEVSGYTNHENARRGIKEKIAIKYADMLGPKLTGINADWLLFGEGASPVIATIVRSSPNKKPQIVARPVGARDHADRAPIADHPTGSDKLELSDLPGPEELNRDLTAVIIFKLAQYLEDQGLYVPPAKFAKLVLAIYEAYPDHAAATAAKTFDFQRFRHIIRLAALSR